MKLKSLAPNAFYDMVVCMPSCIQKDNDGSFLYRYNILPQMGTDEEREEKQVGWQCREIRICEQPNKAVLKKAIIRSVVDESKELGIINDYNKHVLGIRVNQEEVERYKSYLLLTEEINEMLNANL